MTEYFDLTDKNGPYRPSWLFSGNTVNSVKTSEYHAGSIGTSIEREKSVHATTVNGSAEMYAGGEYFECSNNNDNIHTSVRIETHIIITHRPKCSSLSVNTCRCKTYISRRQHPAEPFPETACADIRRDIELPE